MDIEKYFEEQKIEPVQDRKDGMDYWTNYELFTYNDLMECMEDLVKKMSVMRSSLQLKGKETMSFEEWIIENKETETYNAFLEGGFNFSLGDLYRKYAESLNKPLIV